MYTDTRPLTDADVRDLTSGPGWRVDSDGTRWIQRRQSCSYDLCVGACGTPEADYAWWIERGDSGSVADDESGVLRTRADLEQVLAAKTLDELRAIGGAATVGVGHLVAAMKAHDREHAPGSESVQWGALRDAIIDAYGRAALDDPDTPVGAEFAAYWLAIAERRYDDAEEYGDVAEDWREIGGAR